MNQLEETRAVTTGKRGIRLTSKAKLPALVQRAVERSEARQRVDQSRLTMMRGYAETDGCRRQFLLGYLGEDLPEPCSHCDACAAAAARRDAPQLETHTPDDGGRGSAAAQPRLPSSRSRSSPRWSTRNGARAS